MLRRIAELTTVADVYQLHPVLEGVETGSRHRRSAIRTLTKRTH